jgi:hypothetical protein
MADNLYNYARNSVDAEFYDQELGLRLEEQMTIDCHTDRYGVDPAGVGVIKRKFTIAIEDLKAQRKVAKRKETIHKKLPGNSRETAIEVDAPFIGPLQEVVQAPLDEVAQFYDDCGYEEVKFN